MLYVIYDLKDICQRFCGRHFGSPGGNIVAKIVPFYSQNIFRKSHQSVPLNSERFRNGSEKIGLGAPLVKEGLRNHGISVSRVMVSKSDNAAKSMVLRISMYDSQSIDFDTS